MKKLLKNVVLGLILILILAACNTIYEKQINKAKVTETSVQTGKETEAERNTNEGNTEEIKDTEEEIKEETEIIFVDREPPEVIDYQGPYYIKVNRKNNIVTIYALDSNGEKNHIIKTMVCSAGLSSSDKAGYNNDTPLGTFKIYQRYEWRYLYGNSYGQYSVRFNGHILFHSVPYKYQRKNSLKEGEYNKLGERASLGCVRLSVADAKWIYDNCPNGTVVEVCEEDESSVVKPLSIKIADGCEYAGWDPTDPSPDNPWTGKLPRLEGMKDIVLKQGSQADILGEVKGIDYDKTELVVEMETNLNRTEPGTYEIIYSTTGSMGATVYERVKVTVVEKIEE